MEKKNRKYSPEVRRNNYLRNKEKVKKYQLENKEKIRAYQKARRESVQRNPEEREKFISYHNDYYHRVIKPKKLQGQYEKK